MSIASSFQKFAVKGREKWDSSWRRSKVEGFVYYFSLVGRQTVMQRIDGIGEAEKNCWSTNSSCGYRCKNALHTTNKLNPTIYERIIHHNQMRFFPEMQGWFNARKTNIICQ